MTGADSHMRYRYNWVGYYSAVYYKLVKTVSDSPEGKELFVICTWCAVKKHIVAPFTLYRHKDRVRAVSPSKNVYISF